MEQEWITGLACIVVCSLVVNYYKEQLWNLVSVSVEFTDVYYLTQNGDCNTLCKWIGKEKYKSEKNLENYDENSTPTTSPKSSIFTVFNHVAALSKQKFVKGQKSKLKLTGIPPFGNSYFLYENCLFRISRIHVPGFKNNSTSCNMITFSTFKWNKKLLESLITTALESPDPGGKMGKTAVFTFSATFQFWVKRGHPKTIRTASTVLLAEGQVERVVEDVQEFINSRKWYEERSIPHRRGYLLYGPPGCGKTSMVRAIAGEFKLGICTLSLNTKNLTDDLLVASLNCLPHKTLVLIEDIDCAFKSRVDEGTDCPAQTNVALAGRTGSSVTFRGLLNALDGVDSSDGNLVFLTTNHPELLDPALTRPGRVDVKIFVNYPDEEQLGRFFVNFYPEATIEMKSEFITKIFSVGKKHSMAMIQGLFLLHKNSAQSAIDDCIKYLDDQSKVLPKARDFNENMYM